MMFENTLDKYAHSNSLKDVNTYYKFIFAIITMIVCLISTSPVIPLIIFLLLSYLILFKAEIPYKFYLKFASVPFIFAFLTFLFMGFFYGVNSHILELGIFNLSVTSDGFNLGFLVFSRIIGCFACLAFLSLTTPMTDLFSIMDNMKIPKIVLEIAMLMYRYIFLFLDEAINMYHSQETRLGYSNLKRTYKSMGILASNLFIKTWISGEQAYVAMESRCYDGTIKSVKNKESIKNIKIKNILLLLILEATLIIGTIYTASFRLF